MKAPCRDGTELFYTCYACYVCYARYGCCLVVPFTSAFVGSPTLMEISVKAKRAKQATHIKQLKQTEQTEKGEAKWFPFSPFCRGYIPPCGSISGVLPFGVMGGCSSL